MTGYLLRLRKKNGRSAVYNNKLACVICRGFNKFFEAPKVDGKTTATSRTAIVVKKSDFYDEWDVYDAMY